MKNDLFEKIYDHYEVLRRLWMNYWKTEVVFSYQWWLLIAMLIVPMVLGWIIADKSRLKELCIIWLFSTLVCYVLDQIGSSLGLWRYPYTLTPLEREVWDPADFGILPFCYTILYQYLPRWKPYIFGLISFAFFAAFVGGNLFQWFQIYDIIHWKHIYSVPFYILIGVSLKMIVSKINHIETTATPKR